MKHTSHIRHFGHVPFVTRRVERLVEGGCVPKHRIHIRHIGHVLKHTPHIRHIGHVPIIEGLVE